MCFFLITEEINIVTQTNNKRRKKLKAYVTFRMVGVSEAASPVNVYCPVHGSKGSVVGIPCGWQWNASRRGQRIGYKWGMGFLNKHKQNSSLSSLSPKVTLKQL